MMVPLTDLRARFLTALVLGPLVLFSVILGGVFFAVVVALFSILHNWEWNSVFSRGPELLAGLSPVLVGLTIIVFALFGFDYALWVGLFSLIVCYVLNPWRKPAAAFGFLYSTLWAVAAISFRNSDSYGIVVVLFITLLVWGFDIASYFFGRFFGGAKLMPAISPKKTWSGFWGGLGMAGLVCLCLGLLHPEIKPFNIVLVGLVIALAAQGGDLFESAVKRYVKVKDSSDLLPGHGGIMDRIDGLIAAVLVAWVIAYMNPSDLSLARSLFFWA